MSIEIERKFLVTGEFKKFAHNKSRIIQGYICSLKGKTVRVRIRDEKGYLTIKGPSLYGTMGRYEFEHTITLEEANELLKLCEPGIIDKIRYLVDYKGHIFEIDEFFGENEGLYLAEVELKDVEEHFEKPPFIGTEVTDDRRFYNGYLRQRPYSHWKDEFAIEQEKGSAE